MPMHFSTFMKLLSQSTGERLRDIEKYSAPGGGFDFWKPSREGVTKFSALISDLTETRHSVSRQSTEKSLPHNLKVFDSCAKWLDKQSGKRFQPRKSVWYSPNRVFSVHIEPEIGFFHRSGVKTIVAVYPRSTPRLNRDIGGAGIIALREGYTDVEEKRFGIIDARTGSVVWTGTNTSAVIFEDEVYNIERALQRVLAA